MGGGGDENNEEEEASLSHLHDRKIQTFRKCEQDWQEQAKRKRTTDSKISCVCSLSLSLSLSLSPLLLLLMTTALAMMDLIVLPHYLPCNTKKAPDLRDAWCRQQVTFSFFPKKNPHQCFLGIENGRLPPDLCLPRCVFRD